MNTFAGMSLFPVVYSTLSADALLERLIKAYHLEAGTGILFLKRGFNDTYLITEKGRKYILRVYKYKWRNLKDIQAELDLLQYLQKNDVCVSVPLPDASNNYIQTISAPEGNRYAVLFSFAEGKQVKKLSPEQSFQLGVEAGNLHLLTENRKWNATSKDYSIEKQFENCIRVLTPVLVDYPGQFNFLMELSRLFQNEFKNINRGELAKGICHGDLQSENFHITADNRFVFFDFDFSGTGYLIYDIGVFMWYDHKNKPLAIRNAFLDGYESKRKLSKTERRLIPWFSTLRAIFQMTMYCELSDGKQLPLWPSQQVADFVNKIEKWSEGLSSN